eukprot:CAMPEP_0114682446 /NCGR_PEP_ID=MMETSP0191-20121206/56562_1 /TAXON_ID=126664 /ORGANISM="Sorites sp." /LENGTH=205 /DNA_ID=CAMNT_0001962089 /DNA_START=26 /DNA_END=640 /DNA_ORIENTATION=+
MATIKPEMLEFKCGDVYKPNSEWICAICLGLLKEPVCIEGEPSKHVFCKTCIENWFKEKKTNPLTGLPLKGKPNLIQNDKIKNDIIEFASKLGNDTSEMTKKIIEEEFAPLKSLIDKHEESWTEWITKQANKIPNLCCNHKNTKDDIDEYWDNITLSAKAEIDATANQAKADERRNPQNADQIRANATERISLIKRSVSALARIW